MTGDLSFLQQKSLELIWLPYRCKYERFNKERIHDLRQRCYDDNNITISILGDSTVRSIYCGIFRAISVGENSYLPESLAKTAGCGLRKAKRGVHSFSIDGISVEYHSTAVLGDMSKVKPIFPITKSKFTEGNQPLLDTLQHVVKRKPEMILLHSAGWEFREMGIANMRKLLLKKTQIDEIYERNIDLMIAGMKIVIKILQTENYDGIFLWRNAMCNIRYDADIFQKRNFDDTVRKSGYEVFDSFELSRGRIDALHDGYHFDRPFEGSKRKLPRNYFKHEELNALFTNILLNRLFEACLNQ